MSRLDDTEIWFAEVVLRRALWRRIRRLTEGQYDSVGRDRKNKTCLFLVPAGAPCCSESSSKSFSGLSGYFGSVSSSGIVGIFILPLDFEVCNVLDGGITEGTIRTGPAVGSAA